MKRKTTQRLLVLLLTLALTMGLASVALAADREKPVILTVCRGSDDPETLERSVAAAEKALLRAHPRYEIRRAFLSEEAAEAAGEDTLSQALDRLAADAVTDVTLSPLMLTQGEDYRTLAETAAAREGEFSSLRIGLPLIGGEDGTALVSALRQELRGWTRTGTALVFLAGEGEDGDQLRQFQAALAAEGHKDCLVCAPGEGEELLTRLKDSDYKRVVLIPLTVTADAEIRETLSSWQSALGEAGLDTATVSQGLAEYSGVRELFISGVKKAIPAGEALAALTGQQPEAEATGAAAEEAEAGETADADADESEGNADADVEEAADAAEEDPEDSEEAEETETGEPETAALVPGTYPIRVMTSSSRFTVKSAVLTVDEGEMIATLTLEGRDFGELYPGTAAQAEEAPEEELIPFWWNEEGDMAFTVPVESLDDELVMAAWSIRRGCWLDRLLVLDLRSLPADAFAE